MTIPEGWGPRTMILLLAALLLVSSVSAAQYRFVLDERYEGPFRAPIEPDRPIVWLIEVDVEGEPLPVSYSTPPISVTSQTRFWYDGSTRWESTLMLASEHLGEYQDIPLVVPVPLADHIEGNAVYAYEEGYAQLMVSSLRRARNETIRGVTQGFAAWPGSRLFGEEGSRILLEDVGRYRDVAYEDDLLLFTAQEVGEISIFFEGALGEDVQVWVDGDEREGIVVDDRRIVFEASGSIEVLILQADAQRVFASMFESLATVSDGCDGIQGDAVCELSYDALSFDEPMQMRRIIKNPSAASLIAVPRSAYDVTVVLDDGDVREMSFVSCDRAPHMFCPPGLRSERFIPMPEALSVQVSYTIPPIAKEVSRQGASQRVVVSSDEHLFDVPIMIELPVPVRSEREIAVFWERGDTETDMEFVLHDQDGDGWYDHVGWVIPHLSTQVFKVVRLRSAYELDADGSFLRDISDELMERDFITATVQDGNTVRVTFEREIGAGDDITVFASAISGEPSIHIYQTGGSRLLGILEITEDDRYRIILDSSLAAQYDLRIIGGDVAIDHVIDPLLFAYYDPIFDITTQWTCTGINCTSGNYNVLNDGIRRPSVPSTTTDYISKNFNQVFTDEHSVGNITLSDIAYVTLWVYASTQASHQLDVTLLNNGTSVGSTIMGPSTAPSWVSINWTSPSQVENISASFTSQRNGGGGVTTAFVYAWYIEVAYEDLVPPLVDFVPITTENGSLRRVAHIDVNVTASDALTGISNITIRLFNESGFVSQSSSDTSPLFANFSGLADGNYSFNATATDGSSNINTTGTRWALVDTNPPLISFIAPTPANASYLAADSFTVNVSASDAYLEDIVIALYNESSGILLDSVSSIQSPFSNTFSDLADGRYLVNASANDTVGWINTTGSRLIVIDTIAPVISFVAPTLADGANITVNSITANISVVDENFANATIRLYRNGALYASQTVFSSQASHTFTNLPNGNYRINATASDLAGHRGFTENRDYLLDTSPPGITVFSPINGFTYLTDTVLVSFTATDANNVSAQWYFNGSVTIPYTAPINVTLDDGVYTYTFFANDTLGNTASTASTFTVNTSATDTDSPDIIVYSPTAGFFNDSIVLVNFTATDNVEVDSLWFFNGSANVSYTVPVNVTLTDGQYTFIFYANDSSDNVGEENVTFTIDTITPVVQYVSPSDNGFVDRSFIMVNVTAVDTNLDEVVVTITNASGTVAQSSGASPRFLNASGLADGVYAVNAYAIDLAGNRADADERIVTIDTIAPSISYVAPTPLNGSKRAQSFIPVNVSVSDVNLLDVNFTLYSASTLIGSATLTSPPFLINFTSLSDGFYEYNVTARDDAGNTNTTQTRSILLDRSVPLIDFVPPTEETNTRVNRSFIMVNVTASDNDLSNITIELSDSNGPINITTTSSSQLFLNFTELPDGTYFFKAIAVDGAGNTNVTQTRIVEVRTGGPTSPFTSYYDPTADIAAGWTCVGSGCTNGEYDVLNDAIRQPNTPITGDYITQASDAGGTSTHRTDRITENGIAEVILWVYVFTGSNAQLNIQMLNDGVQVGSTSVPTNTAQGWVSISWLNDTAVGNISATFTTTKVGGGPSTQGRVYAWYAEVNYDDLDPPLIMYLAGTDADGGEYNRPFVQVNVSANDSLTGLDFINVTLFNSSGLVAWQDSISSPFLANFTLLADGVYTFNASAYDFAGNRNSTASRTVTIDATPPTVDFVGATDISGSFVNRSWIYADVLAIDAFSSVDNITITLSNASGVVSEQVGIGGTFAFNFTGLIDGNYSFIAKAIDAFGNENTTDPRWVVIDTLAPSVTIISPLNITYINRTVDINYSSFDLYLDSCWYVFGSDPAQDLACANTSRFDLADDTYEVTIFANDSAGNVGSDSVVFTLNASFPDLIVSGISFEPSSGVENQNTTVLVNISNIGNASAVGALFVVNISLYNGSYLFSDTYASDPFDVGVDESVVYAFNWTVLIGTYRFEVFLEPEPRYEVMRELNASNNFGEANYSTSGWGTLYGRINYNASLADAENRAFRLWQVGNPVGVLFFADADASYAFEDLVPFSSGTEFAALDERLDMVFFDDSVSARFDESVTTSFTISGTPFDVPFIESTSGSQFVTGIMWDSADGGIEYDGSQDVVFVTRILTSGVGLFGSYDYEVTLPSRLKTLAGPTQSVLRRDQVSEG